MKRRSDKLTVSAPGRICLFGEHQDYLNLPVIPCAISLRISIEGRRRDDLLINLNLPDIKGKKSFLIDCELPYIEKRDYFRSAVNVLMRDKITFSTGFECVVRGNIPINSGTSSSSALTVAWTGFLAAMSEQSLNLSPEEIARYAHKAEVLEFSEPGGMMDHYSSAIGGTIFLDFHPQMYIEPICADLKTFVLGDSCEPKDTKFILARVKNQEINIAQSLAGTYPEFSLRKTTADDLKKYASDLTGEQLQLLDGTIQNYRITLEAKKILKQKPLNHKKIGILLNEHQSILRDVLKISTLKIDRLIEAALDAGAYGAKINGSGGGGCMFAYTPENPEDVKHAIEAAGGKAYVIKVARGISTELVE